MLIRTQPHMTVLYSTRQATIGDLPKFSGTVIKDLYQYVADLDLLICGPQYWFYVNAEDAPPGKIPHLRHTRMSVLTDEPPEAALDGIDGKPTATGGGPQIMDGKKFTLEVALPVHGKIPTAVLPYFKRIPAFRCLVSRYEGPWEGIGEEYQRMLQYVYDNDLKINGIYAESFLHIDFDDPANQITEILIGLS